MTAAPPYSTRQFYLDDYARTLFPLATNKILIQHGEEKVRARIASILEDGGTFLPQRRVYAAKDPLHVRRTFKLDVVAEFYIYDLVYRNRTLFRKPHQNNRLHFGYRFEDGVPIPPSRSYSDFKHEVWVNSVISNHFIGFDVASYFNSIYHHDLVEWFIARGASADDAGAFDKFLREINSGRSLDCLPHGLYPTKMIGNDFLRFLEENHSLKSPFVSRFMDDVYMFSDNRDDLIIDFAEIQRLLGQKSMSVNPSKTSILKPRTEEANTSIDELKKKLLVRRRRIVTSSLYDDEGNDDVGDNSGESSIDLSLNLTQAELDYVHDLLSRPNLEEDDAELILTVMRNNAEDVKAHLPGIATRFPHLAKNVYHFCAEIADREVVADMVMALAGSPTTQEYQLFWLGMMLDEYLINTSKAALIMQTLFAHPNATPITQAKVLEIGDLRYGLIELRQTYLSSGQSDWLSWAAAVGSRTMDRAARNYRLSYFQHSSPMNELVAGVVSGI